MIVDLFAGAGGWTCGLETLGLTDIGFEIDRHACATRTAAGYQTIRADIATYPLDHFGEVDGLIASPPCQDFSVAGARRGINGDRGQLVSEVLRWAEALRPRWIACEQVPPVLPIWRDYLFQLSTLGYSGWAGILNAADYGVPQTRKRAFLLAHRDRPVAPPRATHAKNPQPSFFHDAPQPWVTMADALGWGLNSRPSTTVVGGSNRTGGAAPLDGGSGARKVYRDAQTTGDWHAPVKLRPGGGGRKKPNRRLYELDEPAPTVAFGHDAATWEWIVDRRQNGAPPVNPAEVPCPTVTGAAFGKNVWKVTDPTGEPVRLTIDEAATLQGFPPSYPWQGPKTAQHLQIGNAVPPPVAAAVVGSLA